MPLDSSVVLKLSLVSPPHLHSRFGFMKYELLTFALRENYNEKAEIELAMKDRTGKKKKGKSEFDAAIKGNEEIRTMRFHKMTFEELEQEFDTNINESKFELKLDLNFIFREGT